MNQPLSSQAPRRVAVIAANWHRELVDAGCATLFAALRSSSAPPVVVDAIDVPGAFEIPLRAQRLARARRHDAIVACALVVNGGIYRHEFVAQAVIDGLMRVQLDTGVPVLSAVLTPRDFHAHDTHQRFFAEHLRTKGEEVGAACLDVLRGLPEAADLCVASAARA